MGKKIFWIGFSSIFVIVGILIFIFGIRSIKKAKASESWPTIEGQIVSSEMGRHSSSDSGTTYSADIEYEFRLNSDIITGSKVKFGELSTSNPSDARKILNLYKKGDKVTIFYNPSDPYDSVLEPGVHASTWFMPVFGLVFALFGTIFVLVGIFMD